MDGSSSGSPEDVDVLIVGYGPVGASLAAVLGRYGVRTLVIDREAGVFTAPRAIALDDEALRSLQTIGVTEDAFAKVAIPRVRMICPYVGEFAELHTSGSVDGHPKLVTFFQPELERALRDLVERTTGVTIRPRTEFTGLREEGARVYATVRDLDTAREWTVRARFLVGADGARSKVREAIGEDPRGESYVEDWFIVDALGVSGDFDHVEFHCDPRRPTPHMVAPGGRTRWEFMLAPGETRESMDSDETLRALLAPWTKSEEVTIERKAFYRFAARSCDRYRVGRVFLAGDAAHVTPPFAGQGLVAGLRDAVNLGWKLAWVVHGHADEAILDSYDVERRPHATKMIALAKFAGHLIMSRSRIRAFLVHGTMKLLRTIPAFRRFTEAQGMKPANAFDEGLFVRGPSRLRRGGCLPQGLVRRASGEILPSDDALGHGLSLVGFGVDPATGLSADTTTAFERAGGSMTTILARGHAASGETTFEDVGGRFVPGAAPIGWCAVVRPDRTVVHDGPAADADRIVRASLALFGGAAASG